MEMYRSSREYFKYNYHSIKICKMTSIHLKVGHSINGRFSTSPEMDYME